MFWKVGSWNRNVRCRTTLGPPEGVVDGAFDGASLINGRGLEEWRGKGSCPGGVESVKESGEWEAAATGNSSRDALLVWALNRTVTKYNGQVRFIAQQHGEIFAGSRKTNCVIPAPWIRHITAPHCAACNVEESTVGEDDGFLGFENEA